MNRKMLLALMPVIFAFVFLGGCMLQPPLENTETIAIYKFKEDASIEMISEMSGTLTSAADQWEDCEKQIKSFIDMAISFSQMAPDLNEEQRQGIEGLKKIKEILKCEFKKNEEENTGTMILGFEITQEDIEFFKHFPGSDLKEDPIKKNEDGTIEVNIPFPRKEVGVATIGTSQGVKEFRVFVEGEVLEFQPESHSIENGYYVFRGLEELEGETLHIKFRPGGAAILSFEMLLIIVGAIIALLILIIIIILWRRKKKKHVRVFEEKPAEASPVQEEGKTIIGEGPEKKSEEQIISEQAPEASKPWQEKLPRPEETQPPQGMDERKIERLVSLLKPRRFEYSEKEVRTALAEEGYSKEIADEVIRRLGI